MMKIELSTGILQKHLNYCLGDEPEASNKRVSLYQKLNNEILHCSDPDIKDILDFLSKNFKDLVIGNPNVLNDIKTEIRTKISTIVRKKTTSEHRKIRIAEINSLLKNIFDTEYERFTNRDVKNPNLWWAYAFVKQVNVSICPYCNSQFIFTYLNDNGRTRPVLDHFFCKSKYPFLGISIYNLVPCCKVCNSDFKGSIRVNLKKYINPYMHEFGEKVIFKREVTTKLSKSAPKDFFSTISGETDDFKLKLDFSSIPQKLRGPYKKHAKLFHIEEIYQYHKKYVKDIIVKSKIYNDIYTNQLKHSYGKLFQSDEDLRQVLIPREDHMNNVILSKLTKDIINNELSKNKKRS